MCADQSHADFGPGQMHSLKWNLVVILQGLYIMTIILFTYFGSFTCFMTGTAVYQLYYEVVLFCTHIDYRSVIEIDLSTCPKNK